MISKLAVLILAIAAATAIAQRKPFVHPGMLQSRLDLVFCDDRAIFDRAVDHFQRGPGNGGITKYVYPSGQCDENVRDQGHAQLGLGYFAR